MASQKSLLPARTNCRFRCCHNRGARSMANDEKGWKEWQWWKKKLFLFGICCCASPFILLVWNIVQFTYVGLVQQMVPQLLAPALPQAPLAPSPQLPSKGEPSSS